MPTTNKCLIEDGDYYHACFGMVQVIGKMNKSTKGFHVRAYGGRDTEVYYQLNPREHMIVKFCPFCGERLEFSEDGWSSRRHRINE